MHGGLDLFERRSLTREADSGLPAIVPGRPEDSELLRRVTSDDEDLQMPPEGPRLAVQQISALKNWIADGADWTSMDRTEQNRTLFDVYHTAHRQKTYT